MSYKNDLVKTNLYGSERFEKEKELKVDLNLHSKNKKDFALVLRDIDFSETEGFKWSKDFTINASDKKNLSFVTNNGEKHPSFVIGFDDDGKNIVSFQSPYTNIIASNSNQIKLKERTMMDNLNNNYQDLQKLLDDFFWEKLSEMIPDNFKKEKEDNYRNLVNYIEENGLQESVSFYLSDILNSYNDSYLRNKEEIDSYSKSSERDSILRRYNICTNDKTFLSRCETSLINFGTRNDLKVLSEKNIRGDKQKSFLDFIDGYQKDYESVLEEFGWRLSYEQYPGLGPKLKANIDSRSYKDLKKELKELQEDLSIGLISKEDMEKIKKLEQKKFEGAKGEEIEEYNRIVSSVEENYKKNLKKIEILYDYFSKNGLNDASMTDWHRKKGDKYLNFETFLHSNFKNFEELKYNQRDDISSTTILRQNDDLKKEISHYLKKEETTDMILLDVRKKAVIDQANYIKKESQNLRSRDIPSLMENIRSLKEIQYKLEVTCGIKDTYLNNIQESQRRALLGENYQYMNFDEFLKKIMEVSQQSLSEETTKDLLEFSENSNKNIGKFMSTLSDLDEKQRKTIEESYQTLNNIFFSKGNVDGKDVLIKNDEELKKIFVNGKYDSEALKTLINKNDSLQNKESLDMVIEPFVELLNNSEYTVKANNNDVVTHNEHIIAARGIMKSISDDVNHRVRDKDSKKQLEELIYNIVDDNYTSRFLDGKSLGKQLFDPENKYEDRKDLMNKIFFTEDGKNIDVLKVLKVRQSLKSIYDCVDSGKDIPLNLEYPLNQEVIEKIRNNEDLKEALAEKIVVIDEKFLGYEVARDKNTKALYIKPEKTFNSLDKALQDLERLQENSIEEFSKTFDKQIDKLDKELKELDDKISQKEKEKDELEEKRAEKLEKDSNADTKSIDDKLQELRKSISEYNKDYIDKQLEFEELKNKKDIFSNIENISEYEKVKEEDVLKSYFKVRDKEEDLIEKINNNLRNLEDEEKQNTKEYRELEGIKNEHNERLTDIKNEIALFEKDLVERVEKEYESENKNEKNSGFVNKIGKFFHLSNSDNKDISTEELIESIEDLDKNRRENEKILMTIGDYTTFVNDRYSQIVEKLEKDLEFSMQNENDLKENEEYTKDVYDKIAPTIKQLKNTTNEIFEDKDLSNKRFLTLTSALKELSKDDFNSFVDAYLNDKEKAKDFMIGESSNTVLYSALKSTFKEVGNKENILKIAKNVNAFYDESERLLDSSLEENKVYNISNVNGAVNMCIDKDFHLVPLETKASEELFKSLQENGISYKIEIGENTSYNLTSKQLGQLIDYINQENFEKREAFLKKEDFKGLEAKKICSEISNLIDNKDLSEKEIFDKINGEVSIKLSDESANALKQVLKSYGDSSSILLLDDFKDLDLSDVHNIGIDSSNIYNVDYVVDNLENVIGYKKNKLLKPVIDITKNANPYEFKVDEMPLTINQISSNSTYEKQVDLIRAIINNELDVYAVNDYFDRKTSDHSIDEILESLKDSINNSDMAKLVNLDDLRDEYKDAIKEIVSKEDIDSAKKLEEARKAKKDVEVKELRDALKIQEAETKEANKNVSDLQKKLDAKDELIRQLQEQLKAKENKGIDNSTQKKPVQTEVGGIER